MTFTVPVTLRYGAFAQLQECGFPIVLVDEWEEVTEQLLNEVVC